MSIIRKEFREPILPLFQLAHCPDSIVSPLLIYHLKISARQSLKVPSEMKLTGINFASVRNRGRSGIDSDF